MAPKDPRQYARIAVDLASNKKLRGATPTTKWLHTVGILWSAQNLSDGQITPGIIAATAGVPIKYAKDLVSRDLWHKRGHTCPDCKQPDVVGDNVIHHYLKHQDSAETVRTNRDEKAKAGRLANHLRWKHAGSIEGCSKCSE